MFILFTRLFPLRLLILAVAVLGYFEHQETGRVTLRPLQQVATFLLTTTQQLAKVVASVPGTALAGLSPTSPDEPTWTGERDWGADLAVQRRTDAIHTMTSSGASPDFLDRDGRPLLITAALAGEFRMVEALLKAGANPRTRSAAGRSLEEILRDAPLHDATSIEEKARQRVLDRIVKHPRQRSRAVHTASSAPERKPVHERAPERWF